MNDRHGDEEAQRSSGLDPDTSPLAEPEWYQQRYFVLVVGAVLRQEALRAILLGIGPVPAIIVDRPRVEQQHGAAR